MSQDTITVFFETGKYKLTEASKETMDQLIKQYDPELVDSALFVGMTDSVGKAELNSKLSNKRAQNTAQYFKEIFPSDIKLRIIAAGEKNRHKPQFNRRVDVILYLRAATDDSTGGSHEIVPGNLINKCYNIDYSVLHRANISSITTKKGKYTVIEIALRDLKNIKLHYYASVSKNGKTSVKKLTWSLRTTGKKWWRKHRYVASIPEKDFKRFKIFQVSEAPCDSCSENPLNTSSPVNETTCLQLDRFLMENIQVRVPFFRKTFVYARVPRDFVNLNDKYFIGCNGEPLVWITRKGRRAQNYYYARLPLRDRIMCNIIKQMDCCTKSQEYSDCDMPLVSCRSFGGPDKRWMVMAEAGNHLQFSEHVPYISLGISKTGNASSFMISGGTDINSNLYTSCRAQMSFLSFPFAILNPFSQWQMPSDMHVLNNYGQLYAGVEFNSRAAKKTPSLMESNIHIGIAAINVRKASVFRKIFIQAGLGLDFTRNYAKALYPVFQVGTDLKVFAF